MWISHPRHPCWRWWWMAVVVVMTLQVITPIYSQECNTSEAFGSQVSICGASYTYFWFPGQDISTITLQLPAGDKTIQVNSSHHHRWHEVSVIDEAARKNPAPSVSAKIYSLLIPTLSVAEEINCTEERPIVIPVVGNEMMYWARGCTSFPSDCPDKTGVKCKTSSPAPGQGPWYYPVAVVAFVLLVGLISFIVFKHIRGQKTRVRDTALVKYSHVQEPGPGGAPKLALTVETVSSHDAGTENPYSDPEEVNTHTDDGRRGSSHESENSIYGWQLNYAGTKEGYVN